LFEDHSGNTFRIWRRQASGADRRTDKELRDIRSRLRELEKGLNRKDKALAEAAALPLCQGSCRFLLKNYQGLEMTMKPYSPERKAAVITRMLPPQNQSVNQMARQEAPPKILYHWRSSAGITEPALSSGENHLGNGHRGNGLPSSLRQRRFLPMLLLNTVAVKAFIQTKFSSGRMVLCNRISEKKRQP
jgi:transposase-like protein